jgi:hypothetical protein
MYKEKKKGEMQLELEEELLEKNSDQIHRPSIHWQVQCLKPSREIT